MIRELKNTDIEELTKLLINYDKVNKDFVGKMVVI